MLVYSSSTAPSAGSHCCADSVVWQGTVLLYKQATTRLYNRYKPDTHKKQRNSESDTASSAALHIMDDPSYSLQHFFVDRLIATSNRSRNREFFMGRRRLQFSSLPIFTSSTTTTTTTTTTTGASSADVVGYSRHFRRSKVIIMMNIYRLQSRGYRTTSQQWCLAREGLLETRYNGIDCTAKYDQKAEGSSSFSSIFCCIIVAVVAVVSAVTRVLYYNFTIFRLLL